MPGLYDLLRGMGVVQPTMPPTQGGLLGAIQKQGILGPAYAQAAPLMPPAQMPVDPSMYRPDGSMKGKGFLGPLKNARGQTMTEFSVGVEIDGKEMDIPSLVPTLTQQEIQHLLSGGDVTDSIVQKAADHARMRIKQGLSPFAD